VSFRSGFRGEKFFAVGDEAFLLGGRQGDGGAGFWREFVEGDDVGCVQLSLPLRETEDVPALDGDPVDAGHVRCGDDALNFEEFEVAFGACGVGDHRFSVAVEVDESEHLSADGLVSDPEDEVVAPLHGLDCMREGKDVGADTFGVDGGFSLPGGTPSPSFEQKPLFAVVYGWSMPPNSCKQMGYG
jgi:hypothetical protein